MRVLLGSLDSAPALGPVAQDHLLQARQMQALSFTAHIPLVCFGIAFPVMGLLMEYRHGVELRDGRAVAELPGDVRRPLRTRLRHRGVLVLLEAIFLGIYVYGWDRLSPRMH